MAANLDRAETSLTAVSDIAYIRGIDGSGNSVRISKADLANVLGVERIAITINDGTLVTRTFLHGRWGGIMCITFASSGKSFIIEIPYYSSFTRTLNDAGGDTQSEYYAVIERRTTASEELYIIGSVSLHSVFVPTTAD